MTNNTPETCQAIGELIVAGKHAGWLRCGLHAWHAVDTYSLSGVYHPKTPHRAVFEWSDDPVQLEDWPEAYDREESFDVEVPVKELPPWRGCYVPPSGWWCSRELGHDGPCAAHRGDHP